MKRLTKIFLIIIFLSSSMFGTAEAGNNWEIYYENTQLKISFRTIDCDFDNQFDHAPPTDIIYYEVLRNNAQRQGSALP